MVINKTKKTIFIFHPSSELYGADKILIYVLKNFTKHNCHLFLKSDGPLVDLIAKELPTVKITIIPSMPIIARVFFKPRGIFKFFSNLMKFKGKIDKVIKEKPDIVYLNTLATSPILPLFPKAKKIVHVHEILQNDSMFNKLINCFSIKRADCIICVSKAVKDNLMLACSSQESKLRVVQNGISFNSGEKVKPFIVAKGIVNVALIGRIKPSHKGQLLFLDSISKMDNETRSLTHFYLFGSTVTGQENQLSIVKNAILMKNLSDCVKIIPFVKEIASVYESMDVIVVPSVFEDPFPTTVLEGMYWSKPIVATHVGGVAEMIEDSVTGYIVEKNNASMLSEKISFLIKSPEIAKHMGKKGRERFDKYFTEKAFQARFQLEMEKEGIA